MGVFTTLLWKHMKERWRRIGNCIWDIASGIMVFVILLLVKQIVVADIEKMDRLIDDIKLVDIFYAPKNNMSETILHDICSQSSNAPSNLLSLTIQCYGFPEEKEVNDFLKNKHFPASEAVIFINFENLDGRGLPKDLEYSIRLVWPDVYNVTQFEHSFYAPEPVFIKKNASFFAAMQWEIDKSYMEMLKGEDINHEVTFQSILGHTSPEMREIHSLLAICTVLAPLPFFMSTHAALVEDKRTGIKALLKLNGVSQCTMYLAHLVDTTLFVSLYAVHIVVLLHITTTPILRYSMPLIIWITFILHFLTITNVAFITSTLSQNYQHSDSVAILFYLMTFLMNKLWGGCGFGKSFWVTLIYFILPHAPVFMFWNDVIAAESIGEGVTFLNIHSSHDANETASSVLVVWLLFSFQLILFLIVSWYLDMVRPGAYGVALAWHFIFRVFKGPKSVTTVVDHANLEAYEGAITVLLGTSGSGKTCLMSIVTGMASATSGHVYINGFDVETRLHDVRRDLAYCAQRNLTFDYLTVNENIVFFQFLKDLKPKENQAPNTETINAERLMKVFKIDEIADFYSKQITHGQRKCLQVVCTLMSDADVLVFDEPTLGMDTDMKHIFWDVLLTLRKSKTILMTTSCMEEADALADRIALIQHGRISCYASPAFLKDAIGADVEISIRLSEQVDLEVMEDVIRFIIEAAGIPSMQNLAVNKTEDNRMMINLPAQQRDHFPLVFEILETNKQKLGILSMNVGVSIEQVFLRFVEDTGNVDPVIQLQDYESEVRLTGWKLTKHRLFWLIKRAWIHVLRHKYQFMFVQILVPLMAFIVITLATNTNVKSDSEKKTDDKLLQFGDTKLFYHPAGKYRRFNDLHPMKNKYQDIEVVTSSNIYKDIGHQNNKYYHRRPVRDHRYILGVRTDSTRTDIYYPLSSATVLPKAVNMFSNQFMFYNVPQSLGTSIKTTLLPLAAKKKYVEPKKLYLCYCWSMWVTFLVIIPLGPLIRLCIEEHGTGSRFNQLLMGCQPSVIWLSKLLAHMVIYLTIVPWSILIVAWSLDADKTIDKFDFLGALFGLLVAFGPAHLLLWYVLSFLLSINRSVARMYIVSLCLGLITPIFVFFLSELSDQWPGPLVTILYILYVFANFIPTFTFSVGMAKIIKVARNNAFCQLNYHLCPNDFIEDIWVPKDLCCNSGGKPFNYYTNFYTGLFELILLLLHWIVYWTLVIMFTKRTIQPVVNKVLNKLWGYKRPPVNANKNITAKTVEMIVHDKMDRLRSMRPKERQNQPEGLLVDNIYKSYRKGCRKMVHSVRGVSFEVKKGECLGIIGQNGSGKSTILSIVSGYAVENHGETCVNGYFWKKDRSKYLQNIIWCKGRGLDDFLSGLDNVQLLAALYGYQGRDALKIAIRYLQYMGLSRYSDVQFRSYSPSCAHRLAVCSALVSSPRVALLDALFRYVDPYTRPFVTRAIQHLLAKDIAIVIAEISLEWKHIDDFCTQLAILDGGEIIAIGTVAEIRHDLSSGYSAMIKLKIDKIYQLVDDSAEKEESNDLRQPSVISGKSIVQSSSVRDLKSEFFQLFETSLLVDEHMSMIYFHIRDPDKKLTYSSMFRKMEDLTKKYDIIEDYILSEASLDEILTRISHLLHGSTEQRRMSIKILTLE